MEYVFRKFNFPRRFGVELEVGHEIKKPTIRRQILSVSNKDVHTSRYNLSTNNDYWHVKDDATCGVKGHSGPKGVEIASFIASGLKDLNHICDVADHLLKYGVKVNNNCGLHIHVDVSDISEDQMSRILASWVRVEPFLALTVPFMRVISPYAEPYFLMFYRLDIDPLNKIVSPQEVYRALKPQDLSYYENFDRRRTLNLVNYCRAIKEGHNTRKTIEFRWPEGTLCAEDIKNWVRLFVNFVEHAKDIKYVIRKGHPTLNEVMYLLGLGHTKEKFAILSDGLLTTKAWLLNRLIKNPDFNQGFVSCWKLPIYHKKECEEYLNFISECN